MISNKNDNPISNEWKQRYSEQSQDVKEKIDAIDQKQSIEYQLKVIKKVKTELKEGDVFILCPRENIYFYGKVIKVNINHHTEDTFVHGKNTIFIFKNRTNKPTMEDFSPDYSNLLIRPAIVDISYWNKGLFFNLGNVDISEDEKKLDYGFYKIGINSDWYCKEDGTIIEKRPQILGVYGITTMVGIASQIWKELIINPTLLEL